MTRLYIPSKIQNGLCNLSEQQRHYLQVVLRKKVGDEILIFNEIDGEWIATIAQITKRSITLQAHQLLKSFVRCTERFLAFALIKNDAMSFLAEKITELGVTQVQPLITDYTQVHKLSEERFQRQMIDAAQQCERFDIPHLHPLKKLSDFLAHMPSNIIFYAALERTRNNILLEKTSPLGFIIGPEGGFSPKEHATLSQHPDIQSLSLGERILRAETASIVCLAKSL